MNDTLDPLGEDGRLFQDALKTELFRLRIRRDARLMLDGEAAAAVALTEPGKIYDPLPTETPELIPGLLPESGAMAIVGETNTGKEQPLDAKVLTVTGWKAMGSLQVGDALASHDGRPSVVLAIHPQGVRQVYRVTFTDGRSTEVGADHLWQVMQANWTRTSRARVGMPRRKAVTTGPRVIPTRQLIEMSDYARHRTCIPTIKSFAYPQQASLPLDPWLLGVLLGDGSLSSSNLGLTSADPELVDRATSIVDGMGLKITGKRRYDYRITRKSTTGPNKLKEVLKSLGVMGCRSWDKFIPSAFMTASIAEREQLIAGLVDTDGTVDTNGNLSYTTTSPKLAEQVCDIVRSLGGLCSTRTKKPFYRAKDGTKVMCRTAYTLHISDLNLRRFVTLSRKRDRLVSGRKRRLLHFKSIVPSRVTETQCITVSHPDGLYITDDFIVTHNSLTAIEIGSSLLTGEPLWGFITPTRKLDRIAYVLGEHTCGVVQALFHHTRLPHAGDFRLIGPEHLHPYKCLVQNGQQQLAAVDRMMKWTEGAGLIVFDPLGGFVQGNGAENDNSSMRTLIDSMTLVAEKQGAACLILAHQGKPRIDESGQEVRRTIYATRGASAVEDALTTIFYLRKSTLVKQQGNVEKFELYARKRKGITTTEVFKLHRDPETLRHTLSNPINRKDVPTAEEKMALSLKVARLMESEGSIKYDVAVKLVAAAEGMTVETAKRWLNAVIE